MLTVGMADVGTFERYLGGRVRKMEPNLTTSRRMKERGALANKGL